MERKTAMFTGVAAAAISIGSVAVSPAAAEPIPQAATYADLLETVPNAMERLNTADAVDKNGEAHLVLAQYDRGVAHHHHHHHHSRRWYRANGYIWNGRAWVRRPVHHHHHHHHHHNY